MEMGAELFLFPAAGGRRPTGHAPLRLCYNHFMGRSLIALGCAILALIVFGHIGRNVRPDLPFLDAFDDFQNTLYLLMAAGAAFVSAVLLRTLSPMRRAVSRNKCRKCGKPIPPKDLYCLSCMKDLQGRRR